VSIVITVVLVLIYRLGVQIQIPFISTEVAQEVFKTYRYFEPGYIGRFSIFSLGLMPYVSAYLMVEICSLFIPFLKKLRMGDYEGRQRLKKIALLLTLPLGVLQGSGIVIGLLDTISPDGEKFLEISGSYEYILLVAILVASLFFLIFITKLISKFGVGHGISIIILSGICADLSSSAIRNLGNFSKIELNMLLLLAAIFSFMVVSTVVLLRTKISIPIYHRSYDSSMIKRHIKSEGVPCHLQGFYHRHLYYFFGPYLDISLMVANDKAEFCRGIIKNYYNGLGLTKN